MRRRRAAALAGEYRNIMNLCRVLPNGSAAKRAVDAAIDLASPVGGPLSRWLHLSWPSRQLLDCCPGLHACPTSHLYTCTRLHLSVNINSPGVSQRSQCRPWPIPPAGAVTGNLRDDIWKCKQAADAATPPTPFLGMASGYGSPC